MTQSRPPLNVYWIDRPDQIAAVASPVRQEIVDGLAALGPMSVRDLARMLRRRPTAVYHHLRRLTRVGLLRTVPLETDRGRPALGYGTVAPIMRLARAGRDPRNRRPLAAAGGAAAKQAGRDYARGFRVDSWTLDGPGRNHWFFRVVATPSPRRLKRMNQLLDELAELAWTPDPRPGPPMTIAWFLAPLPAGRKER